MHIKHIKSVNKVNLQNYIVIIFVDDEIKRHSSNFQRFFKSFYTYFYLKIILKQSHVIKVVTTRPIDTFKES